MVIGTILNHPASIIKQDGADVDEQRDAQSDLRRLELALSSAQELQDLATKYGIRDIFQDNGGKVLQALIILGLKATDGREGNDAVDADGNEYELKTVNLGLGANRGVTTHHHLNLTILAKYRTVTWYISTYEHIRLTAIYRLTPEELAPIFDGWQERLERTDNTPINNPKIPIRFVYDHGTKVWPATEPSGETLPPSSPLRP